MREILFYWVKVKGYHGPGKNGRIGQTTNLRRRLKQHLNLSRKGSNTYFHKALRALKIITADELLEATKILKKVPGNTSNEETMKIEFKLKRKKKTMWPYGWNEKKEWKVLRGDSNPVVGKTFTHTTETKKKISRETKLRMKELNSGDKISETMSDGRMKGIGLGRKHTIKTIKKMREIRLGKKHTKESKRKMSESRKGKKHWNYLHNLNNDLIFKLWKEGMYSKLYLAEKFKVSYSTIHRITGKRRL